MSSKPRFRDRLSRVFKSSPLSKPAPTAAPGSAQAQVPEQAQALPQARSPAESSPISSKSNPTDNRPSDTQDDDESFPTTTTFHITPNPNHWSSFDFSTGPSSLRAGTLHYDFVFGTQGKWARGEPFAPNFLGPRLFASSDETSRVDDRQPLPRRLYDVIERRVYDTTAIPFPNSTRYVAVSHVWGDVVSVDGSKYGVPWPVPIRSVEKLDSLLDAVLILTGERYIWMDVLCLNQEENGVAREAEIREMGPYYRNAGGCLVWLDNAYNDCAWKDDVLDSIEAINGYFKQDAHGMPKFSAVEMFGPNGSGMADAMGEDSYKWIRKVRRIESAPWFRRVWTLQEAVIPRDLFIVTPERYMTSISTLFQVVGVVELLVRGLMDEGSGETIVLFEELQKSETYKMLKLRQAYENGEVGFWHLAQAVRSRSCSLECDRVLGVSGMLQRTEPVIDTRLEVKSLWDKLWKQSVEEGDFSACLYLGERELQVSMYPDTEAGMAFLSTRGTIIPAIKERHTLELIDDGIKMNGVGFDPIQQSVNIVCHAIEGPLFEWTKGHPPLIDWNITSHKALAVAWGLADYTRTFTLDNKLQEYCPAAWAIFAVIAPTGGAALLSAFGPEFATEVRRFMPGAFVQRSRIMHLMQGDAGRKFALVLLWMATSEPQLAIVSEPLTGTILAVMPHSYVESPGAGCLICKSPPEGGVRKIGIGLGGEVKAAFLARTFFAPPSRG